MNDEVIHLGPFPGNRPPYIAYGLLDGQGNLQFRLERVFFTENLDSILIGTDGVEDLLKVARRTIPGKAEAVGPISDLWKNDRYYRNPDMLRRRLALLGRDSIRQDRQTGRLEKQPSLLPDDTTVLVIRRKRGSGEDDARLD